MDQVNAQCERLTTEAENPQTRELDRLPTERVAQIIHAADRDAVAAVERELSRIAKAIDMVAERLQAGGRLFYLGAGTSGRLGVLDAAECPPTFNCPPELVQGIIAGGDCALREAVEGAEDDSFQAREDLARLGFSHADTLVGIAASGRTPYVLAGIAYARELAGRTIGLSCVPGSLLAEAADLAITPDTGAEVITGSTRMKAGTATKLVLNMLSTGAMVKLGYVYGNLMVNVQPTNQKLQNRANRIVQRLTGLSAEAAAALLGLAGSVRIAAIMHRCEVDRLTAEKKLSLAGGRLREALEEKAGILP